MLFAGGLVGLIVLCLWVYCILDVIATQEGLQRNLPKVIWLILVIFLPTIGSIAWLLLGRPERAGVAPGDTKYRRPPPRDLFGSSSSSTSVAPDDDPQRLAEIEKRAEQLKRGDQGDR